MCEEIQERKKIVLPFLITTLNGMAYGLFATLIVGTIISPRPYNSAIIDIVI